MYLRGAILRKLTRFPASKSPQKNGSTEDNKLQYYLQHFTIPQENQTKYPKWSPTLTHVTIRPISFHTIEIRNEPQAQSQPQPRKSLRDRHSLVFFS